MDIKRRDVLKGAGTAAAAVAVGAPALLTPTVSYAQQVDAAKKWIDNEFQPSTLSKDQQMAEMEWFIKASAPFKGMQVSTASEIRHSRIQVEDADQGICRDYRHSSQPRDDG